jgi:Zn-dependent M28 family amino/carboxypeptidase
LRPDDNIINMKRLALLLAAAVTLSGADFEEISAARIRPHVKFLASDLLEGRGVGTRGGQLTTEYLATQFALAGAKPAGENGTFFQKVMLVGSTTGEDVSMGVSGKGTKIDLKWLEDFVGGSRRQTPAVQFDADMVFVGHGITAPEFGWDDYQGVDAKGKVVVLFTNEPPSDDPKFFGGRALTYYGRWTYKYENAARHGALGAIIIHTDKSAGYGWEVVRNSWSGEDLEVKLAPGEYALSFAGWVTSAAGDKIAASLGNTAEELLKMADTRGFQAMPLPLTVKARIPTKVREIETRNVIARVAGSDPKLSSEAIAFSAHWDHFGMGVPMNGDSIYNGAVDNATGCAMLLEMARAWASLQQKPRRSALFIAVTAEEGGLRGSEAYAKNPVVPAGKTALALNFDAYYPFGRTQDVVVTGAERTTVWPVVQEAARRMKLDIKPDSKPEQGFFYRSDHFSFAKAGIPAFSINSGTQFLGRPADYGQKIFEEFNQKNYHRPSDEYREDWDFSGMEQMARFGFLIGLNVANQGRLPSWQPGDEFLAAREQSLK